MNCDNCLEQLEDYLSGLLTEDQRLVLQSHLAECPACRAQFDQARLAQSLVASVAPSARAPDGFAERALNRVSRAAHDASAGEMNHRFWHGALTGLSVAAVLLLAVMLVERGGGRPGHTPLLTAESGAQVPSEPTLPSTAWLPVSTEVRLSFEARQPLEGVTLTLQLPAHLELESHPGHQALSWQVDLETGDNLLTLPVRVLFPGDGELVATLEHQERKATFRVEIEEGVMNGQKPDSGLN